MKLKYINDIKANLSIASSKKTSNILDGTYKSVYRGKSMNFENLREYVINDEVKDIDWKASSRNGTLLVKQFIAEKKHNIMLILDTGKKMSGVTNSGDLKKELALYLAGTIGYIAINNGDYVEMIFNKSDSIIYNPFKYNLYHLENNLAKYDAWAIDDNALGINKTLKYLTKNINRKTIMFIITDLHGMNSIDIKILKELRVINDLLFININDAYMNGSDLFDLDTDSYIPEMILNDSKLNEIEKQIKNTLYEKNKEKLKKINIDVISIDSINEISAKIIELLERHKYASINRA